MKNINETKFSLQKALNQIPEDHALSEVRYHIRVALNKLEAVEKKRERREIASERRESVKNTKVIANNFDPFKAIMAIDEEIAKEKAKIENIQRRRKQSNDDEDEDYDYDEFQTVLG